MFLIISKVLHFLISPAVWVLILLALALFVKKTGRKNRYLIWAISIFIIFSNTAVLRLAKSAYESAGSANFSEKNYSTGIVLGGMLAYNENTNRTVFNEAGDRLAQTLLLYKQGRINKIIVSGGSGNPFKNERKEADVLSDYLQTVGLPESDIVVENQSRNTYENALYTSEIIKRDSLAGPYLLISSAVHLPRAEKCFKKQTISVDTYAANYEKGNPPAISDYLMPNPKNLKDWEHFLHELVGIAAYRVVGYIE